MSLTIDMNMFWSALLVGLIVSILKESIFGHMSEGVRKIVLPLVVVALSAVVVIAMHILGQAPENAVGYGSAVAVIAFAVYGMGYKNLEDILRNKIKGLLS